MERNSLSTIPRLQGCLVYKGLSFYKSEGIALMPMQGEEALLEDYNNVAALSSPLMLPKWMCAIIGVLKTPP